jgi:hypothetical protein
LAYDDNIDNKGWRRLSEGKDYSQVDISDDTLKRYLLPLCTISEYPRNPHHFMHDANDSQLAELLGHSVGGGKLIKEVKGHIQSILVKLIAVLDAYGGPGSQAVVRSFAWMTNTDLRKIVERDFRELTLVLFPSGAWKSSVVLAGSILEAILYDRLTQDGSWVAKAMSATKAPKKKGGIVKDIAANAEEDEWKLAFLIKVASELAVIPEVREETIDRVLREYRNLIHPHKEYREQQACTEAEAMMALGALMGVCDYLEKKTVTHGEKTARLMAGFENGERMREEPFPPRKSSKPIGPRR